MDALQQDIQVSFRFPVFFTTGAFDPANRILRDLVSTPPTCQPGEHGTPQCTVEASDADFRNMIDGGVQAAMSLFFSGKLKVGGDPMLATKLTKLLQAAG